VRDAILEKAEFLAFEAQRQGEAERVFREAYDMTGGASKKIEILFEILLMSIARKDTSAVKKDIDRCLKHVEEGADWEKKNKLKIFEGVYCMMIRDFKKASTLFVSSIATFTALELMSFQDFVFYTVVLALLNEDRKTIKKEIIHSPDILAVNRDVPHLREYADCFYNCNYRDFFRYFLRICARVKQDKFLGDHAYFFTNEMRLVAYKQYLESFKSVTLQNMGHAFGLAPEFIDRDLSNFIYLGKLNCKIDKVAGVIESNRSNKKVELF
jgi:26S proteasome regulatory subunit N7